MHLEKCAIQLFKVLLATIISGVTLWILLNLVLMGFGYIMSTQEYYPSTGIWYCKELQLQLSFDESEQSFIVINEEKILCDHYSERNSRTRYVDCMESESSLYELGQTILCVDSMYINQNEFVVRECENKIDYTFTLIGSPEY